MYKNIHGSKEKGFDDHHDDEMMMFKENYTVNSIKKIKSDCLYKFNK